MNCDGSRTKTEILKRRHDPVEGKYWEWTFGKRPAEELYNVTTDPDCLINLAANPAIESVRESMAAQLWIELREQGDPRITGEGSPVDENPTNELSGSGFYERFLRGEIEAAGWINVSDIHGDQLQA